MAKSVDIMYRAVASFALAMCFAGVFAAEKSETTSSVAAASSPQTSAALPPYSFPYRDGLYASAAGFVGVKDVCFECQKVEFLNVPGICGPYAVRAGIQPGSAPLVVVLLGVGGRPEDQFNKLWASWYFQNGYHVLTFESTFLQSFNERTHHGVGGNVWAETELVSAIIDAFVHQSSAAGRITKIGVVGMSYGGVEALMLGVLSTMKKLPFEIAAIQAYSPPLRIEQAARIIDGWYSETAGKYSLIELAKLQKIPPDPSNPESPICDDMLKAAVSTAFRITLPALVAYSDSEYHMCKLPHGDEFDDKYIRLDHAGTWGFVRFAYGLSYPYWQRKMGLADIDSLIHAADLPALILKQPSTSEVILAQDDPLDDPAEMGQFKAFAAGKHVTILPNGGHLGYVSVPWTRAKLMTLFDAK